MSEYQTPTGAVYGEDYFGPLPLELFDAGSYLECAHACTFLLYRAGNAQAALNALCDDAYLHELLHLALGLTICTHGSMERLREEIASLMP